MVQSVEIVSVILVAIQTNASLLEELYIRAVSGNLYTRLGVTAWLKNLVSCIQVHTYSSL